MFQSLLLIELVKKWEQKPKWCLKFLLGINQPFKIISYRLLLRQNRHFEEACDTRFEILPDITKQSIK